jgi:hypothetical protein
VILSRLPTPAVFLSALDYAAPAFFQHGYPALEAICHDIARWPDIRTGPMELPMSCEVLHVEPLLRTKGLHAVRRILPHLWTLWECVTLAEPILVIASDPRTCSELVWWLRDIVQPVSDALGNRLIPDHSCQRLSTIPAHAGPRLPSADEWQAAGRSDSRSHESILPNDFLQLAKCFDRAKRGIVCAETSTQYKQRPRTARQDGAAGECGPSGW